MLKKILIATICLLPVIAFSQEKNQIDAKGLKQGYWEKKNLANGKIKYKGSFKDDYPDGKFLRYYPYGRLKSEMFFTEKGTKAQASLYNEKGQLAAKGKYINTKKDSIWSYYNEKRNIVAQEMYRAGIKHGNCTFYFKNSNLSEELNFENGQKHGSWKKYSENQKLLMQANYNKGVLSGDFKTFYANENVEIEGAFSNNKKHSTWKYFSAKGNLKHTVEYKNGIAVNQEKLDSIQQKSLKIKPSGRRLTDPENYINNPDEFLRKQMGR